MFSRKDEQAIARAEYLCGYIDEVLEAFQTGTGILGGAPEPITHDVARRLIWSELHRVIAGPLHTDVLSLRIAGPSVAAILAATAALEGPYDWSFRLFGPRQDGALAVAYATARPVRAVHEVNAILAELAAHDCSVRDCTLGATP